VTDVLLPREGPLADDWLAALTVDWVLGLLIGGLYQVAVVITRSVACSAV